MLVPVMARIIPYPDDADEDGDELGERFMQSVTFSSRKENPCWLWGGSHTTGGTPLFWDSKAGHEVNAQRYAYAKYFPLASRETLVDGCDETYPACVSPYHRTPLSFLTKDRLVVAILWSKIEPAFKRGEFHKRKLGAKGTFDKDRCWIWTGTDHHNPQVRYRGKTRGAVRWAYQTLIGTRGLKGRRLQNLCGIPFCVNPYHHGLSDSPDEESFQSKYTEQNGGYDTDCYIWLGNVHSSGYGRYKGSYAHRYAWELENGKIQRGMTVDHLCGEQLCVRVSHLELVTRAENLQRRWDREAVERLAQRPRKGGYPALIRRLTLAMDDAIDEEELDEVRRLETRIKRLQQEFSLELAMKEALAEGDFDEARRRDGGIKRLQLKARSEKRVA